MRGQIGLAYEMLTCGLKVLTLPSELVPNFCTFMWMSVRPYNWVWVHWGSNSEHSNWQPNATTTWLPPSHFIAAFECISYKYIPSTILDLVLNLIKHCWFEMHQTHFSVHSTTEQKPLTLDSWIFFWFVTSNCPLFSLNKETKQLQSFKRAAW